ncbi:MAG: ankyrin repeat domain-containing protein [Chloroflexi bacterium]|nr:ankyrin repeat domain-containing protein [Chloroflexota bacterium]MYE41323.1 ankyrin repeat domain-containing protein [Chloroflexota bacterium]
MAQFQTELSCGADIAAKDSNGLTPLHLAAQLNGNPAVIQTLLDAGANSEAKVGDGFTPLHYAVYSGNPVVVQALLDAGANIEVKASDGWTPLHTAVLLNENPLAVVQVLVDAGANVDAQDGSGMSPVDWATTLGLSDVLEVLQAIAPGSSGGGVSFKGLGTGRLGLKAAAHALSLERGRVSGNVGGVYIHGATGGEVGGVQELREAPAPQQQTPAVAAPQARRQAGGRAVDLDVGAALGGSAAPQLIGNGCGLSLAGVGVGVLVDDVGKLVEGRIAQPSARLDFLQVHLRVVLVGPGAYGVMLRVVGLYEYAARRIASPGAARDLA